MQCNQLFSLYKSPKVTIPLLSSIYFDPIYILVLINHFLLIFNSFFYLFLILFSLCIILDIYWNQFRANPSTKWPWAAVDPSVWRQKSCQTTTILPQPLLLILSLGSHHTKCRCGFVRPARLGNSIWKLR